MKIHKTTAIIIAFLLAAISLLAADKNNDKTNEKVRKTVERLNETIGLDPLQLKSLTQIVRVHIEKVQILETIQDKRLMVSEFKKLSEVFRTTMDSILTPEQKTKLAIKKEAVRMAIVENNKDKNRTQTIHK